MMSHEAEVPDVTAMLQAWSDGDRQAPDALLGAVYEELHRQAARAMGRESEGNTLQATALVHEAYLRLIDQRRVSWRNRSHFFGISAQLMRRILVDHARGRLTDKRGGGQTPVTLTASGAAASPADDSAVDVMALHEALERLAVLDPDQARIVELRYFGGLTIEETAEATGVSQTTVKSEWAIARAWLRRELTDA
jgi:RNA polymerase sigma-70 factor, ECF subfamily